MYKNKHHEPNETPRPITYAPQNPIRELSIDYMGIAIAYDLPLDTPLDRPLSSAQIASLPRTRSCAATSTGATSPTFCTWKPDTAIWPSTSCTSPSCARTKEPRKRKRPSSPPSSSAIWTLAAKLAATHSQSPSSPIEAAWGILPTAAHAPRSSHLMALASLPTAALHMPRSSHLMALAPLPAAAHAPRSSHPMALASQIRRDADEQDFLYPADECLYRLSGA